MSIRLEDISPVKTAQGVGEKYVFLQKIEILSQTHLCKFHAT
jgi:hypothetical protein